MRWWLGAGVLLLTLVGGVQAQVGATLDACLEDSLAVVPATGDVTVDNTAGGVAVLAANRKRCQVRLKNSGAALMRCAPTTATVSATVGWPVAAGEILALQADGRQEWRCFCATSTTAATLEAISR